MALTGTILSLLEAAEWAPCAASLGALVAAWYEISGTKSKLTRYSDAVQKLLDAKAWWDSLSAPEKQSTAKIELLIR